MPDLPGGDGDAVRPRSQVDNSWLEVQALLGTIEPAELIDPTIEPERLLYRLFHEHGVRVFPGVRVADECSCSRERIRGILEGFSAEEIADSTEDGRIRVSCEFCSKDYEFDPAEFAAVNEASTPAPSRYPYPLPVRTGGGSQRWCASPLPVLTGRGYRRRKVRGSFRTFGAQRSIWVREHRKRRKLHSAPPVT